MLKKAMVAAAAAASVIGMSVAAAPQALAISDDAGPTSASGNGAGTSFGNQVTKGDQSPGLSLIQGSVNKPCVAVEDVNVGVIALQDIPIISTDDNQQCAENSTEAHRDAALSETLSDLDILSSSHEDG
ncbi:rodlin [Streptomyces sp. CRN 30]|uniref:rodlin n=1 Tax=Streptomyces sp. CRN 30 TaxID=3075613 RepID=UPI002A82A918|nr:rodlin [Streptomyces sp. CRN 30]